MDRDMMDALDAKLALAVDEVRDVGGFARLEVLYSDPPEALHRVALVRYETDETYALVGDLFLYLAMGELVGAAEVIEGELRLIVAKPAE